MYVPPREVLEQASRVGEQKAQLPAKDAIVRGFLSAALLSYATGLAIYASAQTGYPLVGSLIFPIGFVILSLLGLELVTGNFALLFLPYYQKRISAGAIGRNWSLVYLSHIVGGGLFAYLFYLAWTYGGTHLEDPWIARTVKITEAKTLAYKELGASGWWIALVKGFLCNWMVSLASVLGLTSKDTIGKVVVMWLPIFAFFALGFEHSVVNLFLIPAGILMGAKATIADWWLWNQIPVTLGNILGAWLLTATALYWTYSPTGEASSPQIGATQTYMQEEKR